MSPSEYNQYVKEYSDGIYRYILKNMRNPADAQDVVQITFQRLWEKREDISATSIKSWLFTTAHNKMIDIYRKRKPETPIKPIHGASTTQDAVRSDLKDLIHQALDWLSETQKQLILLRDYEGYSYAEIAEITALSESQVKVYLFRARKKMKEVIIDIDGEQVLSQWI